MYLHALFFPNIPTCTRYKIHLYLLIPPRPNRIFIHAPLRFASDALKICRPAFREVTFQFIITNGSDGANNSISASVDEEKVGFAEPLCNPTCRTVAFRTPLCPAPNKNNRYHRNHGEYREKSEERYLHVRTTRLPLFILCFQTSGYLRPFYSFK